MSSWFDNLPRPQYSSLQRIPTSQSWFHVYAIRPSVFAIYEPYQIEEVISYLIVGSQKSLLIDTGLGIGNIEKVVNELSSVPLTVINTHTHFDHMGDNWRFQQSLIGIKGEFSKKNDCDLIIDAENAVKNGMIREEYLPEGFDRTSYRIKAFNITEYVSDGDIINLGDERKITVIFTPGHTPDSISLFDIQERLLFVGDTFYQGPIFLYRPETNLDDYIKSLEKLISVLENNKIDLIVPSHNIPNVDPHLLVTALDAIRNIIDGKVIANKTDDDLYNKYEFGDFSFVIDPKFLNK
jgi:glyoxylase-like metal-dependent hydrolase (beta-lactamase superfamily II)